MKKILLSIIAATTLFSCSQDQDFTPSSWQSKYNTVSKQSVSVGDGSIVIDGSSQMSRANSRKTSAASQVDFKNVVLICNNLDRTGRMQDMEGSIAVKNSLQANVVTLGKEGEKGTIYTGNNFTGNYIQGGNVTGEKRVGDQWFADKFEAIQNTIDAAMATTPQTGYYLKGDGTPNTAYPYTYYELDDVTYIIAKYSGYINGCVDVDGDGIIANTDAHKEQDVRVPWMRQVKGGWGETDDDGRDAANKYVLIPTGNIYLAGSETYAHIYAPGKEVHVAGGGAPTGLVVCDTFLHTGAANTEIHRPNDYDPPIVEKTPEKPVTPGQPEKPTPEEPEKPVTPEEPKNDCDITIHVDVNKDFIIQADDFAIHNGDILYERIKSAGDHKTMNDYVVVDPSGNINISLNDVDAMYNYYKNKPDYVSADGTLTVECWIWPSKLASGEIVPLTAEELGVVMKNGQVAGGDENYVIGKYNNPALYETDKYDVYVSAFKSIQGNDNSSAIHVSFHIKPKK